MHLNVGSEVEQHFGVICSLRAFISPCRCRVQAVGQCTTPTQHECCSAVTVCIVPAFALFCAAFSELLVFPLPCLFCVHVYTCVCLRAFSVIVAHFGLSHCGRQEHHFCVASLVHSPLTCHSRRPFCRVACVWRCWHAHL